MVDVKIKERQLGFNVHHGSLLLFLLGAWLFWTITNIAAWELAWDPASGSQAHKKLPMKNEDKLHASL